MQTEVRQPWALLKRSTERWARRDLSTGLGTGRESVAVSLDGA